MSDMMTFPDTVEEFMENYKIVDTDEVYTNGAELVPIFRMKQWFEHLPSVQQEPKIGHWIENAEEYYKAINEKGGGVNDNTPYFDDDIACSECLAKFSIVENEIERFDYCPNCGAKMIEPQESEKINCKTTKSESIKKMR